MKYYLGFLSKTDWIRTFIVSILLIVQIIHTIGASPIRERNICGLAHCKDPKKFHYKPGAIYAYQYVVNGTTSIEGGPTEESGLHISSKVAFKFLTSCDVILSMKDVQVWQSHLPSGSKESWKEHHFTRRDSEETFSKNLQEFSLRFSYADGIIEEICPNPEESVWMLNVKRGLLSAFQNTMRRLDLEHKGQEDDVHGKCRVEYKLGLATSSSLTIERTKDIGSCGDKFGIMSSVQGTPYHFGTLHQSIPAVSSTSDCQHVVDRNLVAGIRCSETHRLKSLARGTAGAETKILQILDLISVYDPSTQRLSNDSEKVGARADDDESLPSVSRSLDPEFSHLIPLTQTDVVRRESLRFRHDYHLPRKPNDHQIAKNALKNFCASLKDDVGSNSGDAFEILVGILSGLNLNDTMSLSREATDICQGDRTPFDDALEAVGTHASVHVIKDRILKGDAPIDTINSWIASLTYIPKPDLALMQSAVDILRERDKYPEILLTYSTLAHSYCRNRPDCSSHRPIDILNRLYTKFFLHTNCATRKPRDVDQVLMYLKGIGNFGLYSPGIQDALLKCIHKNDVTEIRVAAINAYRRMGCVSEMKGIQTLFENQLEDAEVRIEAFLTLMRCPNYNRIQLIKAALEREEVIQVGSFVSSFFKNLQETALPSKAELQGLVSDEKFSTKFSSDFRKFSRNFEVSAFYDDFNFGVGLENNWIFSQKSYLPRSGSFNLTVDLFGESINVFEGTLRLENFEHYVESLFGPNGKFRNSELHGLASSFREKRATPNKRKIKHLANEFDASRRYHSDPIASISLRTFGNEILYKRGVGNTEHSTFLNSINPFEHLSKLAKQDSKWQKSKMILDSIYIIPTGTGFPLNLSAQASTILKMDTDTEYTSNESELIIKAKLKPSAMLSVTGSMVLGSAELQTGIKVKAHFRSSTAIEGEFHVKGNELIEAEFGLPKSQLEILDYKSELMFMQGDEFHVVGETKVKDPKCTRGIFGDVFGVRLCRSSYFNLSPNSDTDDLSSPYFPLNGPAYFSITLEKANPTLLSSKLTYVSSNNETNTKLEGTYGIKTTEGIKSFGLIFDVNKINRNFALGIMLPRNDLSLTGSLKADHSSGELKFTTISNNVRILNTMISFVKTDEESGSAFVKPEILIKLYNSRILDANGEIRLEEKGDGLSFDGTGVVNCEKGSVNVRLNGVHNESRVALVWDAAYKAQGDPSDTKTIKWESTIRKETSKRHDEVGKEIDTSLSLQFSEFPDYNLEASWKYQEGEESVESNVDFKMGQNPSWSDRSGFRIHHKYKREENYNATSRICLFRITQPLQQKDWGFELNLNTHGKSLDSTINLQYAPEKKLETSLTLLRAPGDATHFGMRWTFQLPNQHPLKIGFHLQETAHRIYEGKFEGDWFGQKTLRVGMDFLDTMRRQKLDKELKLSIEFGTTRSELLKLRSHIYSDEKESKLTISSEYQNRNNTLVLGHAHINKGSKKHQIYSKYFEDEIPYSIVIESGIDDNGLESSFQTFFKSKLPDLNGGLKVTKISGVRTIGLDYKWDASRDTSKSFQFITFLDSSQLNQHKFKILLTYPTRTFLTSVEYKLERDKSRSMKGKISWDPSEQIIFNTYLKNIQGQSNSYELLTDAQTPFKDIKNTSLKLRINCATNGQDCVVIADGSWGKKGKVSGLTTFNYEILPVELTDEKNIKYDENGGDDDYEDEDEGLRRRRREIHRPQTVGLKGVKSSLPQRQQPGYTFGINSNLTSTLDGWEEIRISMRHTEHDPLHVKTDIDIQLPDRKELSLSSQWNLPRTLKEIWSTRVHFQTKTPFPNYQTFDLQAVLGQKEDADTLATFGIYTDHSQYSMTITGTPKFDKDGSIRFDIITSVPNYDKIFGSLSYETGESSRLACQLGWPKVVIGLETGFDWSESWEEFQVFYTFNSPWKPLKNINTLAKIDTSQAELKFLLNDEGITAKSEWVIETLSNFDIRFDASSPFESCKRIRLIAKHSFEESEEYSSQISGWLNDVQIGYILEGGKAEVEEDGNLAIIQNSQIEIDTIVYPTVRSTFSLAQRESKYNLDVSLLLREGPINVSLELDLLDMFRFNEKVTITTPYPGLFELEINLNPAIVPEGDLYNLRFLTRWRSHSSLWEESGLQVRFGNQKTLSEALTQDLIDMGDYDEEEETGDDGEETQNIPVENKIKEVVVPQSQLFYLYTPSKWIKQVKVEIEKVSGEKVEKIEDEAKEDESNLLENTDDEEESENSQKSQVEFPLKTFTILFSSDPAELSFDMQNEIREITLSAGINLPEIQDPISLKFDSKLKLENSQKKLTVSAASHLPKLQEIQYESLFQREKDFINVKGDLHTPFSGWENQYVAVMYAYNEDDEKDTLDIELFSQEHGKIATNIYRSPLSCNIVLNTPIQGYSTLEFETYTSLLEDEEDNMYETTISTKIEDEEIIHIDLESTIENNTPVKMKGTITTTLRGYEQGNLEAMMRATEDGVNANGQIDWRNEKLTLTLQLKLLERKFNELDMKVNSPIRGYEKWRLRIQVPEASDVNSSDESGEQSIEVRDDDQNLSLLFRIETPWIEFSPINGKAEITTGPSFLVIRRLTLSGNASIASVDIMTSSIFSDWNSFDIHCDSKYFLNLENTRWDMFTSIPKSNFIKFKLRNFIPTFERLQLIDSMFYYETQIPPARYGSTVYLNLDDSSQFTKELTIKLNSKLLNSTHSIDLNTNHNADLKSTEAKFVYATGPPTEIFTSTLQVKQSESSLEGDGIIEWGTTEFSAIQSKFNCRYPSDSTFNLYAEFFQPKSSSPTEVISSIDGNFDSTSGRHKVRLQVKPIGDEESLLVDFNMNYNPVYIRFPTSLDSSMVITSPYTSLPSSGFHLGGNTERGFQGNIGGYIGINKASMALDLMQENLHGGITRGNNTAIIHMPFDKLKNVTFHCNYKLQENVIDGEFQMTLDEIRHIDSTYSYQLSIVPGKEKSFTRIHIENQFWPFGITRGYEYEYSQGFAGLNSQTKTVRLFEIYDLIHQDLHKLGGELRIHTNFNGREITLTGLHPLRNVSISTKYEILEHQFKQNAAFTWGPQSSMVYDLILKDLSTESKEEKKLEMKISYPARIILLNTGYSLEGESGQVITELDLNATSEERKLTGIINWDTQKNPSGTVRKLSGIIKHPSLSQDIRGGSEFRVTRGESLEGKFSLDYSGDPKRRVTFSIKEISTFEKPYYWNLTTNMRLQHSVTNLDLKASHSNRHLPHELSIITLIDFKNSGKLSKESKITFELFKNLKKLHLMLANPDEQFLMNCGFREFGNFYQLFLDTNITEPTPSPKAELTIDPNQPYFRLTAINGKGSTDGIYGEGGVIDARNFKFDISESYDNFRFSDVNFFLRMNHSRLVTSKLIWRPELLDELQASYVNRMEDLRQIWNHQTDKLLFTLSTDSAQVFNQVWENAKTTLEPFLEEISSDCDFRKDSEALSQYFEYVLEENDFYMQDITGLAEVFADQMAVRYSDVFIDLQKYREQIMGDTSELFENVVLWILETAKEEYQNIIKLWNKYKLSTNGLTPEISFNLPPVSEEVSYIFHLALDSLIKTVEFTFDGIYSITHSIGAFLGNKLSAHKPIISAFVHDIETVLYKCLVSISDFVYETRDEVMKSKYYQNMAQLAEDVDQFYKDLLENDFSYNVKKYFDMSITFLQKKTNYEEIKIQFGKVRVLLEELWIEFLNLDFVKQAQASLEEFCLNVQWLADYTHFTEIVTQIVVALYEKGPTLFSQTVLEASAKYEQAKTKFIFDADKGIMELEQKLPMPWNAFNLQPRFSELPEYKGVLQIKEFFDSSGGSVFQTFYHQSKSMDKSWYPPFDGHAMIAGSGYFFTFDGRFYNFNGPCVYLLAADLVDGNFTISIENKEIQNGIPNYNIIVTSSHNTLIIDFETKSLKDPKRPKNVGLPIQMIHLQGYRDGAGNLVVESPKLEFSLVCNMVYRLCELSVSGWYSRKIGGLLGTIDHEPTTDLIHSNGKVAHDINAMAKSWDVSDEGSQRSSACTSSISNNATLESTTQPESISDQKYKMKSTCNKLFANKISSLQPCYSQVKVDPYFAMCENGKEISEMHAACLSAMTYIKMCQMMGVTVQMPSLCVKCDLNGRTTMMDREVKVMDLMDSSPRSTDIVFIVEAKDCNKNLGTKRKLDTIVNTMELELKKSNFKNNRYAVVTFGGEGVFGPPHSVYFKGELFTDFEKIGDHFNVIHTSNNNDGGSRDAFGAIAYALQLSFRPGVRKTLIFLPCTTCQPGDMTMDFSTIHHKIMEHGATIHLLTYNEIPFSNKNIGKKFFGMDSEVIFTKSDDTPGLLQGNPNMRRQVKEPKSILGNCAPLVLKSNGSIWNGKKVHSRNNETINVFSRLFSRRIMMSPQTECQSCQCTSGGDGAGSIICLQCQYQTFDSNVENTNVEIRREMVQTTTIGSKLGNDEYDDRNNEGDLAEDDYEDYADGGPFR